MLDFLYQLGDPQILVSILAAVATVATIVTFAMPILTGDRMANRMKYVAKERDRIRARERARLNEEGTGSLRQRSAQHIVSDTVEKLNLRKAFESDNTRDRLKMAGYRNESHLLTFLFFRFALPIVFFVLALLYLFVAGAYSEQPGTIKLMMALGGAYVGFFAPNLFISNQISKRQQEISRAFPDALDLLLICVESGMSVEVAFRKVSQEIGAQSVALAEELTLTTAELSYLPQRREAYENLAKRTGLEGVKSVTTALIQAERYGTPLGHAMRVMAQENRDMRMAEAEKKAAALPPKLTVPMILFFLPVLCVVILGPAGIQMARM